MKKPLHITIPISKVDEEKRMVYGYATVEEIDAHGEMIGYDASKKAFSNWIGNIRDMHQEIAVGKNMETEFDDNEKGVWIGAHISESTDGEQAWIKVKEGVYAGFSIGGRINDAEMRTMSVDGQKKAVRVVTDYDLGEVSLVDNPACPSAVFQMVKSVNGGLKETEEMHKGTGRATHWWERQFQYSDNQNIIKSTFMTYNENSMKDNKTLIKSLWEADMLIDLAECLSDYIYWRSWEGEDTTDLKTALESIKAAAIMELEEPENFPEAMSDAIENSCKVLNISKKEELIDMVEKRKEARKSVVGQEDRNEDAEVVVTAEENGKPVDNSAAEHEEIVNGEAVVEEESEDEVEAGADDDQVEEDAASEDDAKDEKDSKGKSKGKKSAPVEMKKGTESDDLTKSILSGVADLIEKSIQPLKEEIDALKGQPVASKVRKTFTVKKGEAVQDSTDQDTSAEGELKAEFDSLNKRADELSMDPNAGTIVERQQVAFKLRKLSRQLDPASVAQIAAVKANFNRGQ